MQEVRCCSSPHLRAKLMLVVAASFMARVSSESLLLNSPTGVVSKNATSCFTNCMTRPDNVGSSSRQHSFIAASTLRMRLCFRCLKSTAQRSQQPLAMIPGFL